MSPACVLYMSHAGGGGGLSRIDVLTLPRQTLVRPTGYERCDPCEEVYCILR